MAHRHCLQRLQGRPQALVAQAEDLEACQAQAPPFEVDGVLSAVLALPDRYKDVVYLHCCEGYSTPEIARLLHCPQSTVRNRLARARRMLEKSL